MEIYFAASNSSRGFVNYYGECFRRAERIYIIKGGPGTGKSRFMKRAGEWAQAQGLRVEYYMCSSDPDSIDGVIIEKNGKYIGLLDGTAPHTFAPELIGAREEYVNLGKFWDRNKLKEHRGEIGELSKKKATCFENAYSYLMACGNLKVVSDTLLSYCTDFTAMKAAAKRLVSGVERGEEFSEIPGLYDSIGMKGRVRLDTFRQNADRVFFVGAIYGIEGYYMQQIYNELKGKNVRMRVSHDPIFPEVIDGIYLPESGLSIISGDERSLRDGDRYINIRRFVKFEGNENLKSEIKYAAKLRHACEEGALSELSRARENHFAIEEIYKSAMDFDAVNGFSSKFLKEFMQF